MKVMYQHIKNMHWRGNCSHSCLWAENAKLNTVQQSNSCFHSLRSKCPPLAFTHALSWQCHYLMAESITDWSRRWHSSTTHSRYLSTSETFLLYTLSCITPHILSGNILSKCFARYLLFFTRIWSHTFFCAKSHYRNNVYTDVTISNFCTNWLLTWLEVIPENMRGCFFWTHCSKYYNYLC